MLCFEPYVRNPRVCPDRKDRVRHFTRVKKPRKTNIVSPGAYLDGEIRVLQRHNERQFNEISIEFKWLPSNAKARYPTKLRAREWPQAPNRRSRGSVPVFSA